MPRRILSAAGARKPAGVADPSLYVQRHRPVHHPTEARNRGKKVSPIVEINTTDFLLKTARGNGRASYERIFDMLMRLYGTSIARTIKDGNERQTTPFSLIENFHIKSKKTRTVEAEGARGKTTEKQVWSVTSFQEKISDKHELQERAEKHLNYGDSFLLDSNFIQCCAIVLRQACRMNAHICPSVLTLMQGK